MFLFLPFLFFILLTVFLKRRSADLLWREAVLYSILVFGSLVFLSTEILSLFQWFSLKPLCFVWSVAVFAGLLLNMTVRERRTWFILPDVRNFSMMERALLAFIVAEASILTAIAIHVPPGTWDAMTYHMGRVAHWIQNQTVAYYPTNIQRQLFITPFPEYWIAQFQILFGNDRFANTIQLLSMFGTMAGISLIVREIGLKRREQILSAFLTITLPNAIVEATSTQTDFVATLWSIAGVYYMVRIIKYGRIIDAAAAAVVVFLAFYTKGSTLFILIPFLGWLIMDGLTVKLKHKDVRWKVLVSIAFIIFAAVVSNAITIMKNCHYMKSPVYPAEKGHVVSLKDPKSVLSNHLLHWGMHLRLGVDPIDDVVTAAAVEKIHNWMGTTTIDSPANFPNIKLNYVDFPFYEDEIPNCAFSLIFLAGAFWFLVRRRQEWGTFKGTFFLMTFVCLFIFNSLVKWSPFDGRYHLAFFILLVPFVADMFAARKKGLSVLVIVMVLQTIPFVFYNSSKPFVSGNIELFYKKEPKYGGNSILKTERPYMYFYNRPGLALPFLLAIKAVMASGCREIGLAIAEDTWEYLFWAYLHRANVKFRLEHVLMDNASKDLDYPLGPFSPCMIVTDVPKDYVIYSGKFFVMVLKYGDFNVFAPADQLK